MLVESLTDLFRRGSSAGMDKSAPETKKEPESPKFSASHNPGRSHVSQNQSQQISHTSHTQGQALQRFSEDTYHDRLSAYGQGVGGMFPTDPFMLQSVQQHQQSLHMQGNQAKRARLTSGKFFLSNEEQLLLDSYSTGAQFANVSGSFNPFPPPSAANISRVNSQSHSDSIIQNDFSVSGINAKGSKSKKGSVISPDDRRPANAQELQFYAHHATILHNLNAYNLQYLAFFPQELWLDAFGNAVSVAVSTEQSSSPMAAQRAYSSSGRYENKNIEVKQEHFHRAYEQNVDQNLYFEEFLLEPDNELEPLLNLTFSTFPDDNQPQALQPLRKKSSLRLITRPRGNNSGSKPGAPSIEQTEAQPTYPVVSPALSMEELIMPQLSAELKSQISSLTTFQKTLARYKCREVLGFYKLLIRNKNASKLSSAQVMENSSRFVVRTILNWGREYMENGGHFNRSKIGKHKRVTLFSDTDFRRALLQFAEEKGEEISVDTASQFIRDYHNRISKQRPVAADLPNPPSSRATVHRWLKLLNIKLGPRGKKKGGGGRSK